MLINILKAIAVIFLILFIVFIYAAMKVASDADDEMENYTALDIYRSQAEHDSGDGNG